MSSLTAASRISKSSSSCGAEYESSRDQSFALIFLLFEKESKDDEPDGLGNVEIK